MTVVLAAWILAASTFVGCETLDLSKLERQIDDPWIHVGAARSSSRDPATSRSTGSVQAIAERLWGRVPGEPTPGAATEEGATLDDARAEAAEVDRALLEELRQWLRQDAWQVDVRWTVLTPREPIPSVPWRWVFLPTNQRQPVPVTGKSSLAAADSAESARGRVTAESSSDPQRWNWLWYGDAVSVAAEERAAVFAALRALSRDSGEAGFAARMLLARVAVQVPADTMSELAVVATTGTLVTSENAGEEAENAGVTLGLAWRCAAAEIWVRRLSRTDDPITALIPAGRLLERAGLPDELKMTLWRELSRSIPPDHVPLLSATLTRKPNEPPVATALRRAAVEACVIHAAECRFAAASLAHPPGSSEFDEHRWPPGLPSTRRDLDPRLRQLVTQWAALARHPDAIAWLLSQLRDTDPGVKDAAVAQLGLLQTAAARRELERLARQETGHQRALIVQALAAYDVAGLAPYVTDNVAEVRQAVAQGLAAFPEAGAARLLPALLTDRHLAVQTAAVAALSDWPDGLAVPLLLESLRGSLAEVRLAALTELERRVPAASRLSIDGDLSARTAAVTAWAHAEGWSLGSVDVAQLAGGGVILRTDPSEATARQQQVLALVQSHLTASDRQIAAEAWERLCSTLEPNDVPAVEAALLSLRSLGPGERTTPGRPHPGSPAETTEGTELLPGMSPRNVAGASHADHWSRQAGGSAAGTVEQAIVEQLLPRLSSDYAALQELSSNDVTVRRKAARTLQQRTRTQPLSTIVLTRLAEPLASEQDQLVWQSVLLALQADAHPANEAILLLALHHTWPDVRRLAAETITVRPSARAASWLIPLFRDPQRSVRLAAIVAAGACGHPVVIEGLPASKDGPAIPGLKQFLTDPDEELRWAALESLTRLRDPVALDEIQRLLQHPEVPRRERAARLMGRSGMGRFVEPLIRRSWTESADNVRLTILTALEELVAEEDRPERLRSVPGGGLAPLSGIDDKVKIWAQWWDDRRRGIPSERASPVSLSNPVSLSPPASLTAP